MTPSDRLYAIAEQGLCIGCGLCESVAGNEAIQATVTDNGTIRPVVVGDLTNDTVDLIYDICPGTRLDTMPARLIDDETKIDNVWGPWQRIVRAWAADPAVRYEGSTGGVLSALAQFLLDSERVAFVLHTKASTKYPSFGEATVSRTSAEVIDAAGSRYGPTSTLSGVKALLDLERPFAFIGKPCDISALRNLARHDDRVDRYVMYWLTLVCGGFGPTEFTNDFMRRNGLDPSEVTYFRYRGRGCPGPTVAETATERIERHYNDYWGDESASWSFPWRCKVCADPLGEGADIAVSDTWPGGMPRRDEAAEDPGTNGVVARTKTDVELIEAAVSAGALVIERDIVPDEMSHYQMHQLEKKYAVADRHGGLADEGRIVPVVNGLRIHEVAAELPTAVRQRQREGTRQRIRGGKATEPRPSLES